tara:strand:- start:262 stop:828 length:567 start_codon:yes stop_codon:yes gene_type:complete
MTKCILVFDELENCLNLEKCFKENKIFISDAFLVKPTFTKLSETKQIDLKDNKDIKIEIIENVRILNPKLDRQLRQKNMMKWLTPFGFIAGLTFSNMTNLSTFSSFGLNNYGESLFGGILGMGSGYLGSIVAAASINIGRNKELRPILNFNKSGKWLMILESEIGYELPWNLIKEANPKDIIFLQNGP